MTPEQFKAIFPHATDAAEWAEAIRLAWECYDFDTVEAQAGFLGICGNETGGFTEVHTEDTRWSAATMVRLLGVEPSKAVELARQSGEVRANYCYQHRNGNGSEASGDGWRFRGRGIIQLTGRANYRACGQALDVDLEANPDQLVTSHSRSAMAAAWFMAKYRPVLPKLTDSEASFLAGAKLVGFTDADATKRRLGYRAKALDVLRQPARLVPRDAPMTPQGSTSQAPAPLSAQPQRGRFAWIADLLRALFSRKSA